MALGMQVTFDAADPPRPAEFWALALDSRWSRRRRGTTAGRTSPAFRKVVLPRSNPGGIGLDTGRRVQ
jgi:hypothetical protein